MPTCQNCNKKWSWKQTVKKSFTVDIGMNCSYCGEKQYVTSRSRKRSALISFIGPALLFINIFFGPSLVILFSLIGLVPLFIGLYPCLVELSNEEEPLF